MAVQYSEDFASEVRRALGNHSYRQIARRVGISASYIGDMVQGRVPGKDVIVRFSEGVGIDPNPLLEIAGHPPVRHETENVRDYYHRRFGELAMVCAEHGLQLVPPRFSGGSQSLETIEQAESVVSHLAEMLAEAHPEHAEELRAVMRGREL